MTMPDPLETFVTVPSINEAVSLAASAALIARFLTSSATTVKPAPASPALAASTAAFNASRFVWKAISSIVLIMIGFNSPPLAAIKTNLLNHVYSGSSFVF